MTTRRIEALDNGNVRVSTEFAGASGTVTIEAEYTRRGRYIFMVTPGGGGQQMCRQMSLRGPVLTTLPGETLLEVVTREYKVRDAGETYGLRGLATWVWSGASQVAVLVQASLGWALVLAAPPLALFFFSLHHLGVALLGAACCVMLGAGLLWNAGLRHPGWIGRIVVMALLPILWDVWWFGQPLGFLR